MVIRGIHGSTKPIEVTRAFAANARVDERRLQYRVRAYCSSSYWLRQVRRSFCSQCLVHVREMLAIEFVEVTIIRRMMLRAVPPVPIAALCNHQLFKGKFPLLIRDCRRAMLIKVARIGKIIPRAIVFGSADPNVKVCVDPRTGNQRLELRIFLLPVQRLANAECLDLRIVLERIVDPPEELAAGARIELPGILAVKDDRNQCILAFS